MIYEIEIDAGRAIRALGRAADISKDLTKEFTALNNYVQAEFRMQFETAGQHGGEPWAPLAPATKKARPRMPGGNRGGVDKPLWDTARAKHSLQTVGPESILVIEPRRFVRGTSRPKFNIHQTGSKQGRVVTRLGRAFSRPQRMPARVLITEKIKTRVVQEAGRLILESYRKAF